MNVSPLPQRSAAFTALKLALAALLLYTTLRLLDAKLPFASLKTIRVPWLLAGFAAFTLAQAASILRWHFTASRMNAEISLRVALVEGYLATLLNQTLPFGVGGDALRIARHGAKLNLGSAGYGRALRTHVVERAAGQAVLVSFACAAGLAWAPSWPTAVAIAGTVSLVALLCLFAWGRRSAGMQARLSSWLDEAHAALFARGALAIQIALSTLIIVGCLLAYFCAALSLEVALSAGDVLRIGPLVLAAMALPVGAGGFGPREAASAALFSASALDPGRGTLVSLVYGGLSLLAALPALPLWFLREATPSAPLRE